MDKITKKREQQVKSNLKGTEKHLDKNITTNDKDLDSSIIFNNKKNSAFRFSQYLERKTSFKLNVLPVLSYINPSEDLKKSGILDFSKMHTRKDKLNRHSNNPSVCYYEPNYDVITRNPARVIKFSKDDSNDKRKNIKKILCSYDVPRDYLSVNVDLAQKTKEFEEDFLLGGKVN